MLAPRERSFRGSILLLRALLLDEGLDFAKIYQRDPAPLVLGANSDKLPVAPFLALIIESARKAKKTDRVRPIWEAGMLPGDLATMCATQKRVALALVSVFPLGAGFIFATRTTIESKKKATRIALVSLPRLPRLGLLRGTVFSHSQQQRPRRFKATLGIHPRSGSPGLRT
jgi:hypothetical protein